MWHYFSHDGLFQNEWVFHLVNMISWSETVIKEVVRLFGRDLVGSCFCVSSFQHYMHYVQVVMQKVLPTKFDGQRAFLSNLTPGWPLHDLWPKHCTTLRSRVLPTKVGSDRAFLSNLTPGWPLHDLWPQQCITLWSLVRDSSYQIWWP